MAFEFKIKLKGSTKPPIWRRLKINENDTFEDLHFVIQDLFEWTDDHLYNFSPRGWSSNPVLQSYFDEDYGEKPAKAKDFPYGEMFDAGKIRLKQYFKKEKDKMIYIYDFGDDWQHEVLLEKITDEKTGIPVCTGGKGAAPVEDCGGIYGYYHMVDVVNNPKDPEYADMREWMYMEEDENWDINAFDLDEINERFRP